MTVKTDTPQSNVSAKQTKLDIRRSLKGEILTAKVAESRIRCDIGSLLVSVRETFYPTSSTKRPTSAQVASFKKWCEVNVQIGSSTVDQYIAASEVIARQPAIVEKVTTTRGLMALGRLNDAELATAAEKLPVAATAEQIAKVMAQVSADEKKKQTTAAANGAKSAQTKKREAAKRDEDAAKKKVAKVLPDLMVTLVAAAEDDPSEGICLAFEVITKMVATCGILTYKVIGELLDEYRLADDAAADDAAASDEQ